MKDASLVSLIPHTHLACAFLFRRHCTFFYAGHIKSSAKLNIRAHDSRMSRQTLRMYFTSPTPNNWGASSPFCWALTKPLLQRIKAVLLRNNYYLL
eukprot:scaffold24525_cov162-Cylindrotheca_fusiformis.AAC.4